MRQEYIQVSGQDFVLNNKKILLRGFGIGTWMNIEHFMIGIPGTESMIRQLFGQVYGKDKAEEFFDLFLSSFLTEDDFSLLQKLGVNVIRLAINHHHFLDDLKPGEIDECGFFHIDRVLDLCKKYGIYAILDLHTVPGGQNPDWHSDNELGVSLFWEHRHFQERVVDLWSSLAEHYRDNPFVAGYDIVNEPCLVPDREVFNQFFNSAITAIRAKDKDHIIFLEGDDWAKDFSIFDPVDDPQTAYSFHLYPMIALPEENRGKGARAALEKSIEPFLALRKQTEKPLWCGETGNILSAKRIDQQTALLKLTLDIYEEHKISWSVWSFKDGGTMSLLYPGDRTPWPGFVAHFKKKWDLFSETTLAYEILTQLEEKQAGKFDESLRYRMQFRLRGIFHNIYCEQILKPALQSIPWAEMKEYPFSFSHGNCDMWNEIADLVKSYTRSI